MDVAALLLELYGRIPPLAASVTQGLNGDELQRLPAPGTNSIGWLVWHVARLQDHHISELLETDQLWVTSGWAGRFGLDADRSDMGFGHKPEQVAAVRPDGPELLAEYLDAVQARTEAMLAGLAPEELDRIVDERWDPPVSLGVRLVSVADDSLQHLGQAAYIRGMMTH